MMVYKFAPMRSRHCRKAKLTKAIAASVGLSIMHPAVHELSEAVMLDREKASDYYFAVNRVVPICP